MKVKDLPNRVVRHVENNNEFWQNIRQEQSQILWCGNCGGEYSANSADYFMVPGEQELTCCNESLHLVTKRIVYEKPL